MSSTTCEQPGFDFSTATEHERQPAPVENYVAERLQEYAEIGSVGWSGTREAITAMGENALMLAVTASHDADCDPSILKHHFNDDGKERVVFTVEESLRKMSGR